MPSAAESLFLLYLDKGQGPRPKVDGKLLGSIPLHTMQHQTYQEVICFIPSTTTIKMKGIFASSAVAVVPGSIKN